MSFPQKCKEVIISRTHFLTMLNYSYALSSCRCITKKRMVKKNVGNIDKEKGVEGYFSQNYG